MLIVHLEFEKNIQFIKWKLRHLPMTDHVFITIKTQCIYNPKYPSFLVNPVKIIIIIKCYYILKHCIKQISSETKNHQNINLHDSMNTKISFLNLMEEKFFNDEIKAKKVTNEFKL